MRFLMKKHWRANAMKQKHQIKDEKLLAILDDIERRGTESFGNKLKEIILFGSYATNRQTHESDLNIMFLFDESEEATSTCGDPRIRPTRTIRCWIARAGSG